MGGNLERDFIQRTLDKQSDVLAFARLEKPHKLVIDYRDADGIARSYEVDFGVKTAEKMFLVETKADKDLELAQVALKARCGSSVVRVGIKGSTTGGNPSAARVGISHRS